MSDSDSDFEDQKLYLKLDDKIIARLERLNNENKELKRRISILEPNAFSKDLNLDFILLYIDYFKKFNFFFVETHKGRMEKNKKKEKELKDDPTLKEKFTGYSIPSEVFTEKDYKEFIQLKKVFINLKLSDEKFVGLPITKTISYIRSLLTKPDTDFSKLIGNCYSHSDIFKKFGKKYPQILTPLMPETYDLELHNAVVTFAQLSSISHYQEILACVSVIKKRLIEEDFIKPEQIEDKKEIETVKKIQTNTTLNFLEASTQTDLSEDIREDIKEEYKIKSQNEITNTIKIEFDRRTNLQKRIEELENTITTMEEKYKIKNQNEITNTIKIEFDRRTKLQKRIEELENTITTIEDNRKKEKIEELRNKTLFEESHTSRFNELNLKYEELKRKNKLIDEILFDVPGIMIAQGMASEIRGQIAKNMGFERIIRSKDDSIKVLTENLEKMRQDNSLLLEKSNISENKALEVLANILPQTLLEFTQNLNKDTTAILHNLKYQVETFDDYLKEKIDVFFDKQFNNKSKLGKTTNFLKKQILNNREETYEKKKQEDEDFKEQLILKKDGDNKIEFWEGYFEGQNLKMPIKDYFDPNYWMLWDPRMTTLEFEVQNWCNNFRDRKIKKVIKK